MRHRQDPKYSVPLAHPFEVKRARLIALAEENAEKPLMLVVAPAGFGKSTLVAQVARATSRVVAWLNLTSEESEALVLSRSIARALATALPNVRLTQWEQAVSLDASVERLANSLASDINLLDENVAIVLEMLEHLSEESGRWLTAFLSRLGEGHSVIATYWGGDIAVDFGRFIARGSAFILTEEDLAFSLEETETLFRQADSPLDAKKVWEAIKGWPAAFGMILHGAPLQAAPQDLVRGILAKLPQETRAALPEAAVLSTWSAQSASAFQLALPESWLHHVRQIGLPLKSLGNGQYQPHKVLVDTLEEQLRERPQRHAELHYRIAQAAESTGDFLTAVIHYRTAGQFSQASRLLDELLPRYQRRSEWMLVRKVLEPFQRETLSNYAAAVLGIALIETGRPEDGEVVLKEQINSNSAIGTTYFGLALIAYRHNDLLKAEELTDEGMQIAKDQREITELLRMKAGALAVQGRYEDALAVASECINRAERQGEPGLLVQALSIEQFVYRRLDEYDKALSVGRRAIDIALQRDIPKKAMTSVDTYSETLWTMGRAHEALPMVEQMLRISETDYPLAEPFMLRQRGLAYQQMGHNEQALEQFQCALDLFKAFKIAAEATYTGLSIASVLLALNKTKEAEEAIESALALIGRDDPNMGATLRAELNLTEGALRFHKGELFGAKMSFGLAIKYSREKDDKLSRLEASGYLAQIAQREGALDGSQVEVLVQQVDDFGFDWPMRHHKETWRELYWECIHRSWFAEKFQSYLDARQPQPSLSFKPKLTLKLLGTFHAAVDGKGIKLSSKPQEVLAYLALFGRTRIDTLADAIWPNASLRSAKQTLAQHVRRLREALAQAFGLSFDPLPTADGTYGLSERIDMVVDTADLLKATRDDSLEILTKAVRSYGGPFLPHLDNTWVLEARQNYEQVAASLALAAARQARAVAPVLAMELYERAIAIDPLVSEAYEELADFLEAQHNTAGALSIRRKWQQVETGLSS